MRLIFNIVSVFIIVTIVFLAFVNSQIALDLTFFGLNAPHLLSYHISIVTLVFLVFVAGILVGIIWAGSFYLSSKRKLKEYQRKLEKTSVQSSEDSSKVDVLEAKIEVLEKALKSALEKNNE